MNGFVGPQGATGDTGLTGSAGNPLNGDTGPTGLDGGTGSAEFKVSVGTASISVSLGKNAPPVGVTGSTSVASTVPIWIGGFEPTNSDATGGAVGISEYFFTDNSGTWDYTVYLWSILAASPSYILSWQYNG